MEKSRKTWIILAAAVLLVLALLAVLFLGPGQSEDPQNGTTQQTQPQISLEGQYAAVCQTISKAKNLVLSYTIEENRTVEENHFACKTTGTASFSMVKSSFMTAIVEEKLDLGAYSCNYAESYCEGEAYAFVNDCRFQADMTASAFVKRQVPAILITESLYEKIEFQPGKETSRILFSEPTALESWVGQGELIAASAVAELDGEGNLLQSEYRAEYRIGEVAYQLYIRSEVKMPEKLDLSAVHIAHEQPAVALKDLDAPRKLVQVVADVYAASYVSCNMTESIESEAIPLSFTQTSLLTVQGTGEKLAADTLYEIVVSDYRGAITQRHQTESFRDGVYTVSVDHGKPAMNLDMTAQTMRQYCEDTILSGLFAVKYIQSVTVEEDGQNLRITFAGNDSFCVDLMGQLSAFLKVDLDSQAQSVETITSGGYLTVDMKTGLPVAMGIALERNHVIEGVDYRLAYLLDETLTFHEE